jgi:1-acyl-sn-glycerol-3-phosphate acyltransferase
MTAGDPVAWIYRRIDEGGILFVEGTDLRSHEAAVKWQGRADKFTQEAKAGVTARSPVDAVRLETLSPYLPVGLRPGHPWRTPPPPLFPVSNTSSALCETNDPVSYHLALINRLEEIARDWRARPPKRQVGRRGIDDSKEIAKAITLMKTQDLSAHQAACQIFPDDASAKRRLYGKLPSKVDANK